MPGTRCTEPEAERRASACAAWLLQGASRREVVSKCVTEFSIGERQASRYIAEARKEVSRACIEDYRYNLAVAQARYEALWDEARASGDVRLSLSVLRAQTAIQGLTRPHEQPPEVEDVNAFYLVLAMYGQAMREIMDPDEVDRVSRRAMELGSLFDITDMGGRSQQADDAERLLEQCVIDMRELGRTRTRQELIDAGLIPAECGGGDEPEADDGLDELLEGIEMLDLD